MAETTTSTSTCGSPSVVQLLDELCFSFGEEDCIEVVRNSCHKNNYSEEENAAVSSGIVHSLCYLEVQEYSKCLACQLLYRYRPDYVLVDCHGWPGAEAVAILACLRLGIPFVPVSCYHQHAGKGRLARIVQQLQVHKRKKVSRFASFNNDTVNISAVTCCKDDQDPILGVFQQANVHSILFLDPTGNLEEALDVPSNLPDSDNEDDDYDDMYILFTSGTSGKNPKAVIGSQRSTVHRLEWFRSIFAAEPSYHRVARRTPLTFVDGVTELLGTLLTRQSLLVAVEPTTNNDIVFGGSVVTDVEAIISRTACTQITMLPSQLSQLLSLLIKQQQEQQQQQESRNSNDNSSLPNFQKQLHLKRIIISGEPCSESLWKAFRQVFYDATAQNYSCELINLYGQTETTGDCCGAVLTNLDPDKVVVNHIVTIGKPIREEITLRAPGKTEGEEETAINNNMGVCSHELVVSGTDCFANGYLGAISPENSGFRFNSQGKIVSFYTGDMGFCQGGYWYAQGRKDDVEKINGVWTSPSEVETAFLDYCKSGFPGVAAAIIEKRVYLVIEDGKALSFTFSRTHMKEETGLPWNLIPHQVYPYPHELPRTASTGKVDRARVRQILQDLVVKEQKASQQLTMKEESDGESDNLTLSMDNFQTIVASVLDHPISKIDMSKSFAELGGDSASAISLQYQLRIAWKPPSKPTQMRSGCTLTALDILNTASLNDLVRDLFENVETEASASNNLRHKKPRLQVESRARQTFVPDPITKWDDVHSSVQFAACVDVTPLKVPSRRGNGQGDSVCFLYAGCQNGVIQKVSCRARSHDASPTEVDTIQVLASYHLQGWRISSKLLYHECSNSVLVCANRHLSEQSMSSNGVMAICLAKDLEVVHWKREFPHGSTISSPIIYEDHLWVVMSTPCASPDNIEYEQDPYEIDNKQVHSVMIMDIQNGDVINKASPISLPAKVIAQPVLFPNITVKKKNANEVQGDSSNEDNQIGSPILLYASSDWETGLMMVDVGRRCLNAAMEEDNGHCWLSDTVGPVFKDMAVWDDNGSLLVADSWGSLHRLNLATLQCDSIRASSKALSSPIIATCPTSGDRRVIVGAYDGFVRSIDANLTRILWECNVYSVVYAKPVLLPEDHSLVVCTTAGDVVGINCENGEILWTYRIPIGAEVWSTPKTLDSSKIAFGARDSRLHILKIAT